MGRVQCMLLVTLRLFWVAVMLIVVLLPWARKLKPLLPALACRVTK